MASHRRVAVTLLKPPTSAGPIDIPVTKADEQARRLQVDGQVQNLRSAVHTHHYTSAPRVIAIVEHETSKVERVAWTSGNLTISLLLG